ncbi:putative magnesium transporter MRS2-H [Trichinella spiralis]|uniref:Magnesium transporter MRS2-H n=1 Tax=Trichinella spiralis TaxID=6334 RepID=A0ABR3KVP8_TRISP
MATINPLTGSVVASQVPRPLTMIIWPACCQHPALDPSRYVAALSLNDRFHVYPQRAYYLLVGIPYVQFYGTFIVQCPRPHLRQQRQQKMKKPDISTSPLHSLPSRKQPFTTW